MREQGKLGERGWDDYAREAKIPDMARFDRCVRTSDPDSVLKRDIHDAFRLGVSSVPALLINGNAYDGLPWDFERLVDSALAVSDSATNVAKPSGAQ